MWFVTKDHMADEFGDFTWYHSIDFDRNKWNKMPKVLVRLYDDDGELYIEGVMREHDLLNSPEDVAFAMLDFFEAQYGATRMDYLDDRGEWTTL